MKTNNKGIRHQIENPGKVKLHRDLKLSHFEDMIEHLNEAEVEKRKKRNKTRKENHEYLVKRSKELGKEIPIELMLMTDPDFNPSLMVVSRFMEKYKEWL